MFTLIKFGTRKNMEDFYKGNLHCNSIRSFNKGKYFTKEGRYDRYEGVRNIIKDAKVNVMVDGKVIAHGEGGELKHHYPNYPIFCTYKLDLKQQDGTIKIGDVIDSRMHDFGGDNSDTAVIITDKEEFFRRIDSSLRDINVEGVRGPVIYKDCIEETWNYFFKQKSYSYQSEYRIVLYNDAKDNPFRFNIGSLEDIAEIFSVHDLLELDVIQSEINKRDVSF